MRPLRGDVRRSCPMPCTVRHLSGGRGPVYSSTSSRLIFYINNSTLKRNCQYPSCKTGEFAKIKQSEQGEIVQNTVACFCVPECAGRILRYPYNSSKSSGCLRRRGFFYRPGRMAPGKSFLWHGACRGAYCALYGLRIPCTRAIRNCNQLVYNRITL